MGAQERRKNLSLHYSVGLADLLTVNDPPTRCLGLYVDDRKLGAIKSESEEIYNCCRNNSEYINQSDDGVE